LVNIKGTDVNVGMRVKKCGNFEAVVEVDGVKRVMEVDNNFSLADSVIDSVIDGKKSSVSQLVRLFSDPAGIFLADLFGFLNSKKCSYSPKSIFYFF
jgi:hypothetical protein